MGKIKQYAYTGDLKKLKPAGWTFQKLYADNYKAYHWDDIFMYVKTQMVLEVTNIDPRHQASLIDFILDNADQPDDFWVVLVKSRKNFPLLTLPKWHLTNYGRVVDSQTDSQLLADANREFWNHMKDKNADPEVTKRLVEEKRKKEGGSDSFSIPLDFVQKVVDLHALHPLELIESQWTAEMYD